jgi:hypothetical protein
MATTAAAAQSESTNPPELPLQDFARSSVEQWCTGCHNFLMWEREHILKGEPSEKMQKEHKSVLKWLLQTTKLIHASASDPEFRDRAIAQMIEMTVWKLDHSWKMIYEAKSEPEADKLLAEVFPE